MASKAEPMTTAVDAWSGVDYEPEPIEGVIPSFPEAKLIQKATPKIKDSGRHGGDFWFSDTEEFAPAIEGVIIQVTAVRAFFEDGNMEAPICSSNDGRVPRPGQLLWTREQVAIKNMGTKVVPHGEPSSCATCHFSQWTGDNGEVAPPCSFGFLALIEREDGALYRMRFSGTASSVMRGFLSRLAGEGVSRKAKSVGRPVFSKRIRLTAETAAKGDMQWFTPKLEVTGTVDAAEAPDLIAFASTLREQFRKSVDASHEGDEPIEARPAVDWGDDPREAEKKAWVERVQNGEPPSDAVAAQTDSLMDRLEAQEPLLS